MTDDYQEFDIEIARLAILPAPRYETERTQAAARLGMRVSSLDKVVEQERVVLQYTEAIFFFQNRWWWRTADQCAGPFSSEDAAKKDFEVTMFGPGGVKTNPTIH
jgi:hypothetical protein